MKSIRVTPWIVLVGIVIAMVYFAWLAFSEKDGTVRAAYFGITITLLFPLQQQLDSLGLLGEKEDLASIERKLTEVFSPIHALILLINSQVPAQQARQLTVGTFAVVAQKKLDSVVEIVTRHAYDVGDKWLVKWQELEKSAFRKRNDMEKTYNVYIGGSEQEMFDEMEKKYNHLVKKLGKDTE